MTELLGEIRSDRPLFVVAVAGEAQFLAPDQAVLITGVGKVNAAIALTLTLATGTRPAGILNVGTAGALRPGLSGIHTVASVIQHDLESVLLRKLTGNPYGNPLHLAETGGLRLATGDQFITDSDRRERLAAIADLVDMEGYAVAAVAQRLGLPVRLIKHVSDDADENAATAWPAAVARCARELADWAARDLV